MANFLAKYILTAAYAVDTSAWYAAVKSFFKNLLINDSFRYKKYFDYSMMTLVFVTVGIYLYDIKNSTVFWFEAVELFAILVFSCEYLMRFWVHSDVHKMIILRFEEWEEMRISPQWRSLFIDIIKDKLLFMLHPMSVIDLLAIHPELRPLRLFKIFRYSEITRGLFSILSTKKYEFGILFVLITMTVFIASSLFYVFESDNPKINTYFDAVYWSVITIATVGYGDVVPTAPESKVASIFLVFAGLGVLAMLTSLVTTTLGERISAVREQKSRQHIENLKEFVLVCGFGKMGEELCARLHAVGMSFVAIDIDTKRVERAKSLGYKVFLADASKVETLKTLEVGHRVKSVIALTKDDIMNISIVLAARSISKSIQIIAKSNDAKNEEKLIFAGADEVIGLGQGGQVLAQFLTSPISYQAIHELIADDKHILAEELSVPKNADNLTVSLLEIEHFGCLLLAILKYDGELIFNPPPTAKLSYGDKIVVIGRPKRVEGLKLKLIGAADA